MSDYNQPQAALARPMEPRQEIPMLLQQLNQETDRLESSIVRAYEVFASVVCVPLEAEPGGEPEPIVETALAAQLSATRRRLKTIADSLDSLIGGNRL